MTRRTAKIAKRFSCAWGFCLKVGARHNKKGNLGTSKQKQRASEDHKQEGVTIRISKGLFGVLSEDLLLTERDIEKNKKNRLEQDFIDMQICKTYAYITQQRIVWIALSLLCNTH